MKRRALILAPVLLLAMLSLGAGEAGRFDKLGHKLMCRCGCNQVLLECNHVGCTYSDKMRAELKTAMDRGDSDQVILASFVENYGTVVLAAPPKAGFNWVAWLAPFVVLAVGFLLAAVVVRRWKTGSPHAVAAGPESAAEHERLRERVRQETQL